MPVHLTLQGAPPKPLRARAVRTAAAAMLAHLQLIQSQLSIVLTDDQHIHILNRDYRRKNRPTDVLAFAIREGLHGELAGPLLGDVVISVETAARQAAERGQRTHDEVLFLLAHGLLHLLGWDHDTDAKERAMTRATKRLLAAVGAAPRAPRRGGETRKK